MGTEFGILSFPWRSLLGATPHRQSSSAIKSFCTVAPMTIIFCWPSTNTRGSSFGESRKPSHLPEKWRVPRAPSLLGKLLIAHTARSVQAFDRRDRRASLGNKVRNDRDEYSCAARGSSRLWRLGTRWVSQLYAPSFLVSKNYWLITTPMIVRRYDRTKRSFRSYGFFIAQTAVRPLKTAHR